MVHVAGKGRSDFDIATIVTELALADLTTVEKAQERNVKLIRSGDKGCREAGRAVVQVAVCLNEGKPARTMKLDPAQRALLKPLLPADDETGDVMWPTCRKKGLPTIRS